MADRTADLAVDRLAGDWLAAPLQQLIRAAGLLHPDQPLLGEHVSPSEGFALMELAGGTPLTQRDLTQRLNLEKSTVSRLVAGLERRGLVSRRRDPGNRRFTKVAITDHGLAVVNHLAEAMLERHARLFAIMTPAEREALATGLHALVRALHHVPPAG
jgi:DNA-binding MarR family transcriptional regulator